MIQFIQGYGYVPDPLLEEFPLFLGIRYHLWVYHKVWTPTFGFKCNLNVRTKRDWSSRQVFQGAYLIGCVGTQASDDILKLIRVMGHLWLTPVYNSDREIWIGIVESMIHINILPDDLAEVLVFINSHAVSFVRLDKYIPFYKRLTNSFPARL